MRLGAIDIGSNAIRLQIVTVFDNDNLVSFKNIEYMRFPLRLGKDVFNNGKISSKVAQKFEKLMEMFKLALDLYEVEHYSAVATSAMREAQNGEQIRSKIANNVGLHIDIIGGKREAKIINKAIIPNLNKGQYIHIDVGGGSTELNIIQNRRLVKSKSFKIGSVRKLKGPERIEVFSQIENWIKPARINTLPLVTGIGTGGNINKLFKLANHTQSNILSLTELKGLRSYVKEFSYQERLSILKMNEDRADVIIPASEIYINALTYASCDKILVPKVGLKDGLIYELFENVTNKKLHEIEFLEDTD